MSCIKESAKAGITGLTPRQAAKEALMNPRFQQLDDPLEPLTKELNVSTVHLMCCSCVQIVEKELCSLMHTINIFSHLNRGKMGGHGSVWEGRWGRGH